MSFIFIFSVLHSSVYVIFWLNVAPTISSTSFAISDSGVWSVLYGFLASDSVASFLYMSSPSIVRQYSDLLVASISLFLFSLYSML